MIQVTVKEEKARHVIVELTVRGMQASATEMHPGVRVRTIFPTGQPATVRREDAVKSLAYEAEARLRDPVFGCVGFISVLQNRLRQMQTELHGAKKELCTFIGPQSSQFILTNPGMYPPPPAGLMMPHQSVFNGGVLPPSLPQVSPGHGGGQETSDTFSRPSMVPFLATPCNLLDDSYG
ncbi:hypothetical protein RJT34_30680 [Clitoria ternatea]|uniref:LOB domain-containing protein n=1 Tax=Clitoria ternatea TaxID=43366 RepID=A0AAN9I7L7_CLITE